jgi:hypothetical protein
MITVNVADSDLRDAISRIQKRAVLTRARVVAAVQTSAINIEADIKQSLQRGGRSGRVYKRGNVEHQASAPGEPPKTDLGALQSSYHRRTSADGLGAEVYSDSAYALALEFGRTDGSIEPRPHAFPAAEKERPKYVERVKEALQ